MKKIIYMDGRKEIKTKGSRPATRLRYTRQLKPPTFLQTSPVFTPYTVVGSTSCRHPHRLIPSLITTGGGETSKFVRSKYYYYSSRGGQDRKLQKAEETERMDQFFFQLPRHVHTNRNLENATEGYHQNVHPVPKGSTSCHQQAKFIAGKKEPTHHPFPACLLAVMLAHRWCLRKQQPSQGRHLCDCQVDNRGLGGGQGFLKICFSAFAVLHCVHAPLPPSSFVQ